MYNVSTNFFVLMSYEFMPGKGIGWNNPDALCYLGIPCRPSAVHSDPLPPRLDHSTARDISDLIMATSLKSSVDKARIFVQAEKPPVFNKGRAAFVVWYRTYVSNLLNKRMNAAMAEAQCTIPELLSLQEDDSYPLTSAFNINDIGTEMIGSVICNGKVVSSGASPLIKGLLTATLGRIRKHYNKGQKIILGKKVAGGRDLESSMWIKTELLMNNLMRDDDIHVDGKVVMKVIENIVTISKHISWVPTKMPILDEWRSFLKGLADAEGLEIEFEPTTVQTDLQVEKIEAAKKRGSRKRIHAETMTETDLLLLYDTLVDHFASSQTSVALNPIDEGDADIEDLYKIFDEAGTDMGVTKFRRLDDQAFMDLLDFPEGRPVLFAKYRHKDTTRTPWESPNDRMWVVGGELLQPLRLLWHQLCGVASLVDGVFQKPGARVPNRLLADDVGIGKSAQVMGLIAFLILVWFAEKEGKARPPIIADANRVFMGRGPVPNRPHLLVVPNSLVPQWTQELKTFFNPKQIEIHPLPKSEAEVEAYFQSDLWAKSDVPMILRIVVVSHTAMANQVHQYFDTNKKIGARPFDIERKVISSRELTLFTVQFCVVAFDEIHEFRGSRSRGFIGAVALARLASFAVGCTATPIVSQPRDLLNIGRILRIPECSDSEGRAMEVEFNRRLRGTQRQITSEDKQESSSLLTNALRTGSSVEGIGLSPRQMAVKAVRYEMVKSLQRILGPLMIRRTVLSTRWDDSKINPNLPDKSVSNFCVRLTEDEHVLLNGELGTVGRSLDGQVFDFERFWVQYRQCLCVPLPDLSSKPSKDIIWPIYKTQEDFQAAGSKLKKLIELVRYHLDNPDAAQVKTWSDEKSDMVWPDVTTPREAASRNPLKILIFFHFSAMRETIASAFTLHNIQFECITGSIPLKKRTAAINRWKTTPDIPVLLFSTVMATGMNLCQGRIVIHLDVSWSGVFQQQIDGRAWRYGQLEAVLVYHMVALGTTDVTMSSMAGEKMLFLGALTTNAKDHILEKVLQEMEEDELEKKFADSDLGEDEEDEDDADADDHDDDNARPRVASKKGKLASAAKGKKVRRKRQADPGCESEDVHQSQSSQRKDRDGGKATAKPVDVVVSSNEGMCDKGEAQAVEAENRRDSMDDFSTVNTTQNDEVESEGGDLVPLTNDQNPADSAGPMEDIGVISTPFIPTAVAVALEATAESFQAISLDRNTTTVLANSKRKANSPEKSYDSEIKRKRLLSPDTDTRISLPPLATSSASTAGHIHRQSENARHLSSQEPIHAVSISSSTTPISLFSSDEYDEKDEIEQTPQYRLAHRPQVRPQPLPLQSLPLRQQQGRALTQEQAAYRPQSFSFRGTSRHHRGSARGTSKG